ncbi:MAG TPA: TIGR03067 domain-containing protein [Gemmataceae bacterium]|nr:TIGR03067 domain-containing protein [Gemmataceae bacterium]
MRRVVLAMLVIALLVTVSAPSSAGEKAGKKDEELIQGTWSVVSGEKEGQKAPEEELKDVRLTFAAGGKLMVKAKNKDMEGTYKLDSAKKPKEIDVTVDEGGKELVLKGIYLLTKDSLKICLAHPPTERPTEFATQAGVQTMLIIFRRAKE